VNVKYFEEVVKLVLEGCLFYAEPQIQKRCFGILRGMTEHFGGHDQNAIGGFNTFLYQQVIRLTFTVPADARFNFEDALSNTVHIHTNILTISLSLSLSLSTDMFCEYILGFV
jgi:hypothetical protein